MDEQTAGNPPPDPSSSGNAAPADEALRTLALRLLSPRYSFQPMPAGAPALLVGQIPDPLPFAVALPPASRIVGSLVQGDSTTIVLDCDLPPEGALAFVREHMPAEGWSVPEPHHPPQGGFAFGGAPPMSYIQLCRADRTAGLRVSVFAQDGQTTDMRLELETYRDPRHSPCAPQMRHRDVTSALPLLVAPVGAAQRPEGGGGGSDTAHSSATLDTELDLAAVAAHYRQQLAHAGWVSDGEGIAGPVGWGAWHLKDDEGQPWRGLLFIQQETDPPRRYFLLVRAMRESDESQGGQSSRNTVSMVSFGRTTVG